MKIILVTGGTGALGREVVKRLQKTDNQVRIMSRQDEPSILPRNTQWAQADLLTGHGLTEALDGIEVIVNCASSPGKNTKEIDILGTQEMLYLAKQAGVRHILHISIVGIDRVSIPYYRHKLSTEQVIEAGDVPFSIIRFTQFHTLLDQMLASLTSLRWLPILPLPKHLKYQLIDPKEVADYLLPIIFSEPAGRLPDVGGPEILTFQEIAQQWLDIQGHNRSIVPIPLFGKLGQSLKKGDNTTPSSRYGKITWQNFLHQKYASSKNSEILDSSELERLKS